MKETIRSNRPEVAVRRSRSRRPKNPPCSICAHRTWFSAMPLMEPEGVPEPRQSWVLCQRCYGELIAEMRRSPVRTPLRLRIAMGIVASERWPQSSARRSPFLLNDHTWITLMAWGFVIAMLLHLALIVMLAFIAH